MIGSFTLEQSGPDFFSSAQLFQTALSYDSDDFWTNNQGGF